MSDKAWKRDERKIARFFGCLRTPLSGGSSRHTRSDTLHPLLFIEVKRRKRHALLNVFHKAKALALKENKIPVVTVTEHGKKGFWLLVHCDDLLAVANQRTRARMR